jgi:hypothetical protein
MRHRPAQRVNLFLSTGHNPLFLNHLCDNVQDTVSSLLTGRKLSTPNHTGMTEGPNKIPSRCLMLWCDNPSRCDEEPRANGVDKTTTQSGLRGTAPRQRKPEHVALHRDHDSAGRRCLESRSRRRHSTLGTRKITMPSWQADRMHMPTMDGGNVSHYAFCQIFSNVSVSIVNFNSRYLGSAVSQFLSKRPRSSRTIAPPRAQTVNWSAALLSTGHPRPRSPL